MGTLVKYVAFGGFACIGIATAYRSQVNGKLRKSKYFLDAMTILDQHKASNILGKPIQVGQLDTFSAKNYADEKKVSLYIPVYGSICKGQIHLSAIRNPNDDWSLTRVELELNDDLGGTALIFDSGEENSHSNI